MSLLRAVEETLAQHVSAINARAIVERSRRVVLNPAAPTHEDRARLVSSVRATVRLFTSDTKATEIIAEIERRLLTNSPRVDFQQLAFAVGCEGDLRAARIGARDLCLAFSPSTTSAQRVATAVSELCRNIIAYTPGGRIEISVHRGPPALARLLATDTGSGIPQLSAVLGGTYRSKTGLGRGLLGVQRLMHQFHIETGATGTRIEAEVTL
jgi:serine/threonine-protein kinase RsbT